MRLRCFLTILAALASDAVSGLINNDWATLERDVTLRYFSYENFHPSSDQDKIWDEMGENVTCTVNKQGKASVVPPSSFDASRSIKLFMHGYTLNGRAFTTNFLPAWMERYKESSSVILLDWHPLAKELGWKNLTDFAYDEAAYNGIDVGEFAGLCLAELSNSHGLGAELIHLVGHSLGGQSVGKMGRSFQSAHRRGQKVRRITGLDPAGPRFETNGYQDALHDLKTNILTAESAGFVDVIHSNGGFTPSVFHAALHFEDPRMGYLQQLGHMDFYPDGGSHQVGCPATWISLLEGGPSCSHTRSLYFYFHSINEKKLFPSKPCKSAIDCNKKLVQTDQVLAYMGEDAEQYYQGGKQLFYTDVKECNWNYKVHDNEGCSTVQELTDAEKGLIQEIWVEGRNQEVGGQWPIDKEVLTTTKHPFVKQVSTTFQKMLQQSINQISNSTTSSKCDLMNAAFTAVIRARQGLDCGGSDHSTNLGNIDNHLAVIDAVSSCLGSEDEHLCLMSNCNHLGDTKCSSLRVVENGLKNSLAIFCHDDSLASGSCGYWKKLGCAGVILAASSVCTVEDACYDTSKYACFVNIIGRRCMDCFCPTKKI